MARHLLTEDLFRKLEALIAWRERFAITSDGPVKVLRQGDVYHVRSPAQAPQPSGAPGRATITARVVSHARDGGNWRWTYVIRPRVWVGPGLWTYADDPAYSANIEDVANLKEANNGASGVMGNGVDVGNLSAGFEVQPVPVGTLVEVWQDGTLADGSPRYVFDVVNGVDGACPE
jgi:hypothetical protein